MILRLHRGGRTTGRHCQRCYRVLQLAPASFDLNKPSKDNEVQFNSGLNDDHEG